MKAIIGLTILWVVATAGYAQKMKVKSGDFDFLDGQEQVKVVLDFSDVTFYKEKMSEQDYVEKRIKEIEEKNPEESAKWQKEWTSLREGGFLDKFVSVATKNSIKADLTFTTDGDSPYTLVVKATWIYPGWYGGVMKQHAKISTQLNFVETANPNNVVLSIEATKAPGDIAFVGIPNTNTRIKEGFAKTGKTLALLIDRKL